MLKKNLLFVSTYGIIVNKDPRLAVASVSIPYGQRFLSIDLAKSSDLIEKVSPHLADGRDEGVAPTLTVAECSLFINNILNFTTEMNSMITNFMLVLTITMQSLIFANSPNQSLVQHH